MLSLIRLLIKPHRKLLLLILVLLIRITAWFTFLSQTLQSITGFFASQTLENLGGDITIEGSKPLTTEQQQAIEDILAPYLVETAQTVRFFTSLPIGTGDTLLTSIVGVDEHYPLYGDLILTGTHTGEAHISTSLATQLGDSQTIQIGERSFTLGKTIVSMPGAGLSVFDGGRTVLLPMSLIEETGLITVGSRVEYRTAYKLTGGDLETLARLIQESYPELEIDTAIESREQLAEFFAQLRSVVLLALCSLVILTYTGTSIINSMLLHRMIDTIKLLRLLGTTRRRLLLSALGGTCIILLITIIGGSLLGYHAWQLLPREQFAVTPMRDRGVYIRSLIVTVGIVGALSFSRKMIVRADDLHATSLYAIDQTKQRKSRTVIGIVLLATLLAELGISKEAIIIGAVVVLVLIGLYRLVKKGIQTLAYLTKTRNKKHRARWWVIRRSSQPGSALPLVITIMTSIVLVVGIALLFRVSLKRFITSFQTTDQPNTFILNVRTDDREPLSTILSGAVFYDIILGRIISINDRSLSEVLADRQLRTGRYTREFNMTTITLDDEITAGRNTREPLGRGEVSIDSEIAHALGIQVGDQIVMSIVGREFPLSVVQLRRTTRNGVKPFFFFQLSAEQFVDAPRSYFTLSTISADNRADTMKTIVQSVGQHLSFIEIDAIITQIQEILQAIAWSIIIVFSSVLLCGMIIFLLCMRFVTEEHESDARLLHLLGVEKAYIDQTSHIVRFYPVLASGTIGLIGILISWIVLSSVQDAIPFETVSVGVTISTILVLLLVVSAIVFLSLRQKKAS